MPFEPGVTTNPTGRNGKEFKAALLLAVKRADGDKTKLAKIAEALVDKALTGDVQAINAVADRLDGKAAQPIGGDDELPAIKLLRWATEQEATPDPSKSLSHTTQEKSGAPSMPQQPVGVLQSPIAEPAKQ